MQHFVDRMFLTWYSPETIAAAMPAGMLNFTIISIFMGTAGYVSTFVAQYYGAGRYHRIGPALWQGIYISLIGYVLLLLAAPLVAGIFPWAGHEPSRNVPVKTIFPVRKTPPNYPGLGRD